MKRNTMGTMVDMGRLGIFLTTSDSRLMRISETHRTNLHLPDFWITNQQAFAERNYILNLFSLSKNFRFRILDHWTQTQLIRI